jgi:hypothetical protein
MMYLHVWNSPQAKLELHKLCLCFEEEEQALQKQLAEAKQWW